MRTSQQSLRRLVQQCALAALTAASLCAASAAPALTPLRVAFAPHPFLSHWAVSAPVAQELLDRGHSVLVSPDSGLQRALYGSGAKMSKNVCMFCS